MNTDTLSNCYAIDLSDTAREGSVEIWPGLYIHASEHLAIETFTPEPVLGYTPTQAILAAYREGRVEIQPGVYLCSREWCALEQDYWLLEGEVPFDFSARPYWITDDLGSLPIPVRDAADYNLLQRLDGLVA